MKKENELPRPSANWRRTVYPYRASSFSGYAAKKKTIYVTGHKNPDTDSICSAIGYAEYLNTNPPAGGPPAGGKKAVACRTGEINPETKFVLDYFKFKLPQVLGAVSGKKVILLDHNEKTQSPDNIEKAEIIEVIDHHKIGFQYENPILFKTEPLGATATIIAKIYFQDKRAKITKNIAGLLLSAILSDTVVFRSPTTTNQDKEIAKKLAEISGIKNIEKFGIEIKKKKSSLKGLEAKDIIFSDSKDYNIGNKKIGIGQIEVIELNELKEREQELINKIEELAKKQDYDLLLLMATDIIKMGSLLLFWEKENYIEKAFGKKLQNNTIYLKGVMSRKKEVVPPLTKLLSKN
jgi:manganese-dependent inorganic pyrophosphatase